VTELEKQTHIIEQLLEIAAATDLNFAERENQTCMNCMIMAVITSYRK